MYGNMKMWNMLPFLWAKSKSNRHVQHGGSVIIRSSDQKQTVISLFLYIYSELVLIRDQVLTRNSQEVKHYGSILILIKIESGNI